MEYIILFIMGTIIGSFANMLVHRLPENKSIISPPSSCPQCGKRLGVVELIPVLGWLILRGKCSGCSLPIPARYLLIELISGTLFVVFYLNLGFDFFFPLAVAILLLIITGTDLEKGIVPPALSATLLVVAIIFRILEGDPIDALLGVAVGAVPMVLMALLGAAGGGDFKVMVGLGVFLGFPYALMVLVFSFIIGALAGVFLLGKKKTVPFVPFIFLGTVLVLLAGDCLLDKYLALL